MSKIIVVDPFDYVVFGGTGDLAKRKLFPALYHRELDGQLPEAARIIGVARSSSCSDDEFRAQVEKGLREFVPASDLDEALRSPSSSAGFPTSPTTPLPSMATRF